MYGGCPGYIPRRWLCDERDWREPHRSLWRRCRSSVTMFLACIIPPVYVEIKKLLNELEHEKKKAQAKSDAGAAATSAAPSKGVA